MKTVYVIEDQMVLKDFIIRLISEFPTLKLMGASEDGQIGYRECLEMKPNMVILDVMLPGLNGIEILRRLKRDLPGVLVLGFSAFPSKQMLKQMVEGGADGLVQKSESLEILEKAMELVASGQTFFSPNIVSMLRDIMLHPEEVSSLEGLSTREREILQLIAESHTNKNIAEKLHISVKTAETHRNNIMKKLGIHDAVGLTRYAIAQGLVDREAPS